MTTPEHPWNQLPGEPDAAYRRFLTYLSLGTTRTLRKAAATERNEPQQNAAPQGPLSGQWGADSAAYDWVRRALLWDCEMLEAACAQTVVKTAEALNLLLDRLHDAIAELGPIDSWEQVLKFLNFLCANTTSFAFEAVHRRAGMVLGRAGAVTAGVASLVQADPTTPHAGPKVDDAPPIVQLPTLSETPCRGYDHTS
jgi:hypothetical protein